MLLYRNLGIEIYQFLPLIITEREPSNLVSCYMNILPSPFPLETFTIQMTVLIIHHSYVQSFYFTLYPSSLERHSLFVPIQTFYIGAAVLPLSRNQTLLVSCAQTNNILGFLIPFSDLLCRVAYFAVFWYHAQRIITKYRKENYFHRAMLIKPLSSYYKAGELCESFEKNESDERNISKS